MKKLILIMLAVLTVSALAYRIPVEFVMGGGLTFDSLRVIAKRMETNGTSSTVKDTFIISSGTEYLYSLYVDSLTQHVIVKQYYSGADIFREDDKAMPLDYEKSERTFAESLKTAVTTTNKANFGRWTAAQLDSVLNTIKDANKVNFGRWSAAQRDSILNSIKDANKVNFGGTFTQAQVDSLASQLAAALGGASGGCPDSVGNSWTITAWDSINNVAVPNAVISLKSSVNSPGVLAQSSSSPFTFIKANGSAAVVVTANGVTFPVRTITITGTRNDTIFGGGIIVAAADSPSEATVYGTVDCPSCYVRFELMAQGAVTDTSTGYLISRKVYNIKTNSIGFFSRSLLKTENLLYQSGTQRLQPKWKITISPTDVVREPLLEQTFSVDSDSTSLDIGGLIR